jgi:EAL domain-containing protein (putative c-di-GMP-specific phosphodiesterase class I)
LVTILADMKAWREQGIRAIPVAVNVDPYQLEHTDYAEIVRQHAAEAGVDPQWLTFEITETTFLSDTKRVVEALDRLRSAGSKIYIDDFGTGYSGLSYLSHLPVDGLKVDQAFVRDIVTNPAKLPIVKAVLELAHSLGLSVVAEGVETPEQLVVLSELGCDCAQGFFLGHPIAARDCAALLDRINQTQAHLQSASSLPSQVDWTQLQRTLR